MNMYKNTLGMKLENIGDGAIWTATNNYFVRKQYEKGKKLDTPKIKYAGIKLVKGSTPVAVKKVIKEFIPYFLDKKPSEMGDIVRDFLQKFKTMPVDTIAFPKGVKVLNKYSHSTQIYGFKTPIYARAALLYNHYVRKLDLKDYKPIRNGQKIKYIYLVKPNPIKENVIGFIDVIPKEFKLDDYIDYDTQFVKLVAHPLDIIARACGWSIIDEIYNPKVSSEDFFDFSC